MIRHTSWATSVKYLIIIGLIIVCSGCSTTFKGRMIDAENKLPVHGAVVVGIWTEEMTNVGATHYRIYEIREAVTDSNGYWDLTGRSGSEEKALQSIASLLTGIYFKREPWFYLYKPGYCPIGFGTSRCSLQTKIFDNGNGVIIYETPQIADDERRTVIPGLYFGQSTISEDEKNQKLNHLIDLINSERKRFHLGEY